VACERSTKTVGMGARRPGRQYRSALKLGRAARLRGERPRGLQAPAEWIRCERVRVQKREGRALKKAMGWTS